MIYGMKYQLMILAGLGYGLLVMGEITRKADKIQTPMLDQKINSSKEKCLKTAEPKRAVLFSKKGFSKNPAAPSQEKSRTILIEIVPELMKFHIDTFTVLAGEKIMLELDNLDGMQHNLLIIKPGTLEKVGAAADAMLRDPKASEKHYVPDMPEVLFATEMLGPEELYTLNFTVPDTPGDYPFVCTFPGHWRMMNGIMRVEGKK